MTEFSDYDNGFRAGTFDKCNGVVAMFERDDTDIWVCGYFDGYDGNEVLIEQQPTGSTFDTDQANTPQRFFKLWCEWDYGQDGYVFDTEQAAKDWLTRSVKEIDGDEPNVTVEEMFDEGLAGLDIVTLIR